MDDHVMSAAGGHQLFFHVVDELDGLAGHLGKHDRAEISCQGIVFRAAEPSSYKGLDYPDFVEGKAEAGGQMPVDKIGALLGGPDGDTR